jgi:hypothetical protein
MESSDHKLKVETAEATACRAVFPLCDFVIVNIPDKLSQVSCEALGTSLSNIPGDVAILTVVKGSTVNMLNALPTWLKTALEFESIIHIIYERVSSGMDSPLLQLADFAILWKKGRHLRYDNTLWYMADSQDVIGEMTNATNCWMRCMSYSGKTVQRKGVSLDTLYLMHSLSTPQHRKFVLVSSEMTQELARFIATGSSTCHMFCSPKSDPKAIVEMYQQLMEKTL